MARRGLAQNAIKITLVDDEITKQKVGNVIVVDVTLLGGWVW